MSEPYDGAATSFVALIQQLQAGSISAYDAALALAPVLAAFSPDDTTQFGEVIKVLGRVDGMLLVDGPPANTLGTVGATAIDLDAQLFYPPKTEAGWTAPAVPFVGGQGPAGQISSATVTLIDASLPASIVLGGTAENRTMEFRLPNPTQAATALFDIMARSSFYAISDLGFAAKFASAGLEMDFLSGYYRQGINVRAALANVVGWSFARTSTGTARNAAGLISSFASGAPRITDLGLLIEQASTNQLLHSKMDQSPWSIGGPLVRTANAGTAPDGTNTATRIESTGNTAALFSAARTATATTGVFSVFIKKGSGATQANRLLFYNPTTGITQAAGTVNLDTGAITWTVTTGLGSLAPTQAEDYGNGWWRVHMPITSGITVGNSISCYAAFSSSAPASGEWSLVWGAQWEDGRQTPTSYIPTTTAAVGRVADDVIITGALTAAGTTARAQFRRGWNTVATETILGTQGSGEIISYLTGTGGYMLSSGSGLPGLAPVPTQNTVGRTAVTWSPTGRRLDFSTTTSAGDGVAGPANTNLRIGGYGGGNINWNGFIQRLLIVPQTVNQAQLEALAA